jgi:hypothetical protein
MESSTKVKKIFSSVLYVVSAILVYDIIYKIVILIKDSGYNEWNLKLFIITLFIIFDVFALQQFLNKVYKNIIELSLGEINYPYYQVMLKMLRMNSLIGIILFTVNILVIPILLVITYSFIKIPMQNIIESILEISFCFLFILLVADILFTVIIELHFIVKRFI